MPVKLWFIRRVVFLYEKHVFVMLHSEKIAGTGTPCQGGPDPNRRRSRFWEGPLTRGDGCESLYDEISHE